MNGHKRDLLRNIHGNSKLQRFYNKYGRLSLTFEILEFCDKNVLNEKEAEYIKFFDCIKNGFNIKSPFKNSEYTLSPEHSKKISDGHKLGLAKNLPVLLLNLIKARESRAQGILNGTYIPVSPRKGIKLSDVSKERMKNAKLGKSRNWVNETKEIFGERTRFNKQGEKSHYAKLSEKSVIEIKELLLQNIHKQKIADKFNISLPTIYDIESKRSWKHLL